MLGLAWLGQTTFVRVVAGVGVPVDLVLVAVVFAALSRGPVVGLWTGTLGGLVQDVLSGGIVGVSGLTKSIIGTLVGLVAAQFIVGTVWHRLLILFAASLVHALCFSGVYALVGSGVPVVGPGAVAAQAVVNALVGAVAEGCVRLVPGAWQRFRDGRAPLRGRHWMMG